MSDLKFPDLGALCVGHESPHVDAKHPEELSTTWLEWEYKPTQLKFELKDSTSSYEGEPSDVEAFRLLQQNPVNWAMLEEALGLDAQVDSITFEFDETSKAFIASVRLIPGPRAQELPADDTPVPSERPVHSAQAEKTTSDEETRLPGKAALVQRPLCDDLHSCRVGSFGRETWESYGGTD